MGRLIVLRFRVLFSPGIIVSLLIIFESHYELIVNYTSYTFFCIILLQQAGQYSGGSLSLTHFIFT